MAKYLTFLTLYGIYIFMVAFAGCSVITCRRTIQDKITRRGFEVSHLIERQCHYARLGQCNIRPKYVDIIDPAIPKKHTETISQSAETTIKIAEIPL